LSTKREEMSDEEKKRVLWYLMFLKEKRSGSIKARGWADGWSQRDYTTKVETSSPTISLEAMMLSRAIHAKEGRHVTVTNIPGAFLHADMYQDVHMLVEGTITELIINWNQNYIENIVGKTNTTN